MSEPVSRKNEPSKMNKLLNGRVDQSIQARLPRATDPGPAPLAPASTTVPASTSSIAESQPRRRYSRIGPIFWTIASIISLLVNFGLVIALVVVIRLLGGTQAAISLVQNQATGLLGGLHSNFVKMDAARIQTTIHVEKEIPVQFSLNVSGPTDVVLSREVVITGALVTVNTGGLNINRARADIVLPAGTLLPINIQNLVVPVDQKVMAVLDVPVDIPLNQTDLHEPFVGLQKVVEPYYCLLQPNTVVDGVNVCETTAPIFPIPTPAGTAAP
jgi:hypothetical protein